jgi:hypothetical protein
MRHVRSTLRAAALVASALLAINACGSYSIDPATKLVVQTSQAVYDVPAGASFLTIHATVTNTLDETLLLDGIGRDLLRLEKLVGGSWRLAYTPVYILPLVPDIELPPGESRQLAIGLHVGNEPNTSPKFEFELPGTYRAVFGFRVSGSKGFEVHSNEFELREAS